MDVDMVISPWLKRRRHTTPLHGKVFPGRAVENVVEQGPGPAPQGDTGPHLLPIRRCFKGPVLTGKGTTFWAVATTDKPSFQSAHVSTLERRRD